MTARLSQEVDSQCRIGAESCVRSTPALEVGVVCIRRLRDRMLSRSQRGHQLWDRTHQHMTWENAYRKDVGLRASRGHCLMRNEHRCQMIMGNLGMSCTLNLTWQCLNLVHNDIHGWPSIDRVHLGIPGLLRACLRSCICLRAILYPSREFRELPIIFRLLYRIL